MTRRRAMNSSSKSARRRRKPAAGGDSCPAGAADRAHPIVWGMIFRKTSAHPSGHSPEGMLFRIVPQMPALFLANRGRARYQVRTRLEADALGARTAWSAAIAQSVEHVIRNDGVGGSNPSCGTKLTLSRKGRIPENPSCRQIDCRSRFVHRCECEFI